MILNISLIREKQHFQKICQQWIQLNNEFIYICINKLYQK